MATRKPKAPRLDDLHPAEYNPRHITEEGLRALTLSLDEFGDLSGITWNQRSGNIVTGHQRIRSLREEHGDALRMRGGAIVVPGGGTFKVRVVDWPDEKERMANVVANSHLIGGYFTEDVEPMIDDLLGSPLSDQLLLDELLTDLGFDRTGEDEIEEDEIPEPPKKAITKPGDLWVLGDHRVLCGDSTDGEAVERIMGGNQAQMVFTDPPYGVEYDGGAKKREKLKGDRIGTDIYGRALPHLRFAADDNAALYLWYADGHAAAAAAAAAGYEITAQIIWAKNHAQFVTSAHYKGKHEPCYYAHRQGKSARWHGPNNEVTLWEYDRSPRNDYHPTQKPVAIAARAIGNSSAKQDGVLDLFLGGGTTLVAAEQLDRRCYGIELDPIYCDVIVERWEALTGSKATRTKA